MSEWGHVNKFKFHSKTFDRDVCFLVLREVIENDRKSVCAEVSLSVNCREKENPKQRREEENDFNLLLYQYIYYYLYFPF